VHEYRVLSSLRVFFEAFRDVIERSMKFISVLGSCLCGCVSTIVLLALFRVSFSFVRAFCFANCIGLDQ
jgi:hypothetical protein